MVIDNEIKDMKEFSIHYTQKRVKLVYLIQKKWIYVIIEMLI